MANKKTEFLQVVDSGGNEVRFVDHESRSNPALLLECKNETSRVLLEMEDAEALRDFLDAWIRAHRR